MSEAAERQPGGGRRYDVVTVLGFDAKSVNFLVCPDCGNMVGGDKQNEHDLFHFMLDKSDRALADALSILSEPKPKPKPKPTAEPVKEE